MLPTFSGLNTSKLGVMTHQSYLYTTGHNIANSATQGYSRQRVTSVTTPSIGIFGQYGKYQVGTGVDVSEVVRVRDFLVDRQYWKQSATNSYFANLNSVQSSMETIFTEPSETNVQAMLDNFWTAVQNVASNPADVGTRTTMRQAAVDIVNIINTSRDQLGVQVTTINENISKSVDRINQITKEVLSLNKQISEIEYAGATANDLRDKRDLLIDELSSYAKTNVYEDARGNYTVSFDGQVIVTGTSTIDLEVYENKNLDIYTKYGYQTLDVRVKTDPPVGLNFTDGSIAGLLEARDSNKQGVLSKLNMLDDIAKSLLCDFNQIHKEGLGLDNSTGLNFFGEQGVQYAALSTTVTTNPITGLPITQSTGFDPVTAGANNSEKNWMNYLKVNELFFDSLSGLDKIAAKTLAGNLEISLSTENRVDSFTYTGGTPAPSIEFVGQSTKVFKSPSVTDFAVTIGTIDSDGYISAATYTMTYVDHDGTTKTVSGNVDCTNDTGTSRLTFKGTSPIEYNLQLSVAPAGDSGNALAVGDTIDMEIYPSTAGSMSIVNSEYTRYESRAQTEFTLITKTVAGGAVTDFDVSFDGGATTVPVSNASVISIGSNSDGTGEIYTVSGILPDGNAFTFQVEVKNDAGNTVGDKYIFKMPPGDAASDNVVRMAQFLKYGADDEAVQAHSMYMGDSKYKATLKDKSIDEYYNEGLSGLGVQTQTSYSMWLNQQTLVEQISTVRSNYKDVSLDEEMSNMIQFQKGYNSNARMLTTIDEMLDKLINGTGRVGL